VTADERQRLHRLLDTLDAAVGALHDSNAAFDTAVDGMKIALGGVSAGIHAQGAAITAFIAANRAVIDLLNTEPES